MTVLNPLKDEREEFDQWLKSLDTSVHPVNTWDLWAAWQVGWTARAARERELVKRLQHVEEALESETLPAAQETAEQWWKENATKFHWCQDWWGGDEAESLCQILEAYAASRVQMLEARLAKQDALLREGILAMTGRARNAWADKVRATLMEDFNGG